jgi:hypothetical protein
MPPVNGVGEPCAGEPHARFEAAGAGNGAPGYGHAAKRPAGETRGKVAAGPDAGQCHRASPRPYHSTAIAFHAARPMPPCTLAGVPARVIRYWLDVGETERPFGCGSDDMPTDWDLAPDRRLRARYPRASRSWLSLLQATARERLAVCLCIDADRGTSGSAADRVCLRFSVLSLNG